MAVRHAFTVTEWHRMGEAGLFGEDARLELLDGEVIEMAPIGSRHASCVARLNVLLISALRDRAVIFPQSPVSLDDRSEPVPDLAVLSPRSDGYSRSHPRPEDVLLLIEVSDSTLVFDRDRKAAIYARAGVAETWVVDLEGDEILVLRSPQADRYTRVRTARRGEVIGIGALGGVALRVEDILGPDWPAPRS
jgi:Uma2 family endonuclease